MANLLRERRTERGLSQAGIAVELGVSRQTVIAIESGRYSPSLPLAFRIARFFGSTVDEMFDPSPPRAETGSAARPTGGGHRVEAADTRGSGAGEDQIETRIQA